MKPSRLALSSTIATTASPPNSAKAAWAPTATGMKPAALADVLADFRKDAVAAEKQ
jgi:hypothetical protein